MNFRFPILPQLSKFSHLPHLKLEPLKKILLFPTRHKFSILLSLSITTFFTLAFWNRANYISQMKSNPKKSIAEIFHYNPLNNSSPTIDIPSPTTSDNNVMGTNDNPSPVYYPPIIFPTAFPTFPPLPSIAPQTTYTNTTKANTSASSNTGNSSCTTGAGVPNAWYSDVYPNPPVSTNTGSVNLIVYIRDCNKNTAPVNDNLTITLSSDDSTARINGSSSPVTIQAQNGQANFSVSSTNNTTDTFVIQDTTNNFTITDINNHNPTVTFTNNTNNTSGNSNCTTAAGVPNAWYSDVYPASPVSANTGSSVTFSVILRDCNKNTVSVSDTLTFSQTSNDSGLTVNGSAPPVSLQAQNGQASFNVVSQNAGTDTFTIKDTTNNFTITDTNNHNPSVVFSGSSTPTSAPTSANSPTPNPSSIPTTIPSPSASPIPTPTQSASPTPRPTGT